MASIAITFKLFFLSTVFVISIQEGIESPSLVNFIKQTENKNDTQCPSVPKPGMSLRSLAFDRKVWQTNTVAHFIMDYLRQIAKHFPKTTKLIEVGKTGKGNSILGLELTHSTHVGATVVIGAGMDTAATKSSRLIMFILEQLCVAIEYNFSLFAGIKYVFVPIVDVDYYNNNLQVPACRPPLDRDFDIGPPPPPSDSCFKGFFSQPETRALNSYYSSVEKFKLYVNVHARTPTVAIPFAYKNVTANSMHFVAENMKTIINTYALIERVNMIPLHSLYGEYSGAPVDYVHEKLSVPYSIYYSMRQSEYNYREEFEAYFAGLRYIILHIQLTDPDVAMAILNECSDGNVNHSNTAVVLYAVVILIYFK